MKTLPPKLIFAALIMLAAAHATVAADGARRAKIKVFLLAGQSNMEGKGDGDKLTPEEKSMLARAQTHVRFAYNHQPIRPLDVTPAGGNKKRFGVDHTFGPELFFGLRVAEAWPNESILLIKRSVGATSLQGCWNPDWTREKAAQMKEADKPKLYGDFIAYVREILGAYDSSQYEICGMLWVQGEADGNAASFGPEPGEAYGQNLRNLIAHVRQDTGVADLPFLLVQVGAPTVVEGMKSTAAAVKNVTFIPQSKDPASPNFFPLYPVGHYNYEGQKRIGSLLADAYLRNYGARARPATVVAPSRQ